MDEILTILERMNPWWQKKGFETGIKRHDYLKKIQKYLSKKEIVVVTGIRRSGKTTLLMQAIESLLKDKIDPKRILFVNFDEPALSNIENPIEAVLKEYEQEISDEPAYLFLDEIQSIKQWPKWAKFIYDQKKHQLAISGSSSKLLDDRQISLISGRYLKIIVYPLSFNEYLRFNSIEADDKLKIISNKNKILKKLKEFLVYGGFPRVALEKETEIKDEFLKTYFESIVFKDIISMHDIRNTKIIRELIYYLCTNFTSEYSYKKLVEVFKIDFSTLKEYISYIESSRIFTEINFFSYSLKKQEINNKKPYIMDNGIRSAVSFRFSLDIGKLAENLVLIELKRKNKDVYYWKAENEVDFIVKDKDGLYAINVSYTNKIDEREKKGLREFNNEFDAKQAIIITKDLEKDEEGIRFIPLWKWLIYQ